MKQSPKGKALFAAKAVFFIAGVAFLIISLQKLGVDKILRTVIDFKFFAIPVIINSFIWYLFYTSAWRNYFIKLGHQVSYLHLLKIRICGEAVSVMTPLSFVAGDPVRVYLINHPMDESTKFSSIIVDRLLHTLATLSFVFVGILLTFSQHVISLHLKIGLLLLYSALLGGVGFAVYELVSGHGIKRIHRILVFMRLTRKFSKLESSLVTIGDELKSFAGDKKDYFIQAWFYHFLGRVLGAVEVAIIFYYLTGETHLLLSLILVNLTSAIHLVFSFVPGGIGVVESLYAGFFYFYHLDPALGISMQFIRRLRALFWLVLAFILMNTGKKQSIVKNG